MLSELQNKCNFPVLISEKSQWHDIINIQQTSVFASRIISTVCGIYETSNSQDREITY